MRAGKLFVKERGWGLQKHMQEKVMSEKIVFRIDPYEIAIFVDEKILAIHMIQFI